MAISNTQRAAMAAVILVGVVAGAAILFSGRDHGHEDGHDGHGHDEPATQTNAVQGERDAVTLTPSGKPAAAQDTAAAAPRSGQPGGGPGSSAPAADAHAGDAVRLSPAQLSASGVTIATAGPATVQDATEFPGEIKFNDDMTAHVVPRVGGVVERVPASIGQQVRKGEVLAVIASPGVSDMRSELQAAQRRLDLAQRLHQREKTLFEEKISAEQDYLQATTALQESQIAVRNATEKLAAIGAQRGGAQLNQYELRAPFDGVIVEKHISLGEAVADNATVFTLSDLRSVWAEFVVSAQDLGRVRVGQQASIHAAAFAAQATGRVSYIGSLLGQQTRTATARVTLANPDMAWRPGLFVTVRALVDRVTAPVAVEVAAIQTVDDKPSVFVVDGDALRARPVTVGRSSSTHVEIVSGLQAGERYASGNSFVLKSELGKSSAEHTH